MSETATQTVNTRNQGTVQFQTKYFFIFNNEFIDAVFKNNTGAAYNLQGAIPVIRDTTTAGQVIPMTSTTLNAFIGFVASEGILAMASNATANIRVGTKGTIDPTGIIFPDGVTLDTVMASDIKAFRDYIELAGLHIESNVSENTKFDN